MVTVAEVEGGWRVLAVVPGCAAEVGVMVTFEVLGLRAYLFRRYHTIWRVWLCAQSSYVLIWLERIFLNIVSAGLLGQTDR